MPCDSDSDSDSNSLSLSLSQSCDSDSDSDSDGDMQQKFCGFDGGGGNFIALIASPEMCRLHRNMVFYSRLNEEDKIIRVYSDQTAGFDPFSFICT